MFKIYDGREDFYQWDLDRKLIVEDASITQVHFCNRMAQCSVIRYVYELNGLHLVDVPNLLLQNAFTMNVYGYDKNHTRHDERFKVIARSRPENYIYTEEELKAWEVLNQRINDIEENGIPEEVIEAKVNAYLEENPIEAGATAEEAAQIEANKTDIAEIKADYATKTYVDEAVAAIEAPEADLSDYATKAYVDEALKDVDVDMSDYYTKGETDSAINAAKPDMSKYATTSYVDTKVSGIPIVDTTKLATKTEVTTQINNRFTTEMANYYDKAATDKAISDALVDYPTATYIAGKYATKTHVSNSISTALADYETKAEAQAKYNYYDGELEARPTMEDVQEAIASAQIGGEGGGVDLSEYLKIADANRTYITRQQVMNTYYSKTEVDGLIEGIEIPEIPEIPDVSGFQTATQVNTLIDNKLAAIGVAEEGAY